MEQRKYTLERAKAHYRHVNTKFKIDHAGNLLERSLPVTPVEGTRKNRSRQHKSMGGIRSRANYATSQATADYPIDVFNHNSRKAFYKFKYARNPSFYGNTTSTRSNQHGPSYALGPGNFHSE